MLKSYERIRIHHSDCGHMARVYAVDHKLQRIYQEYVPHEIDATNVPANLKEQIEGLSACLQKYDHIIDDMHLGNMRLDARGTLKTVDGEVMTTAEHNRQARLLGIIDASQKQKPKTLDSDNRVFHWQDGRPSVLDVKNFVSTGGLEPPATGLSGRIFRSTGTSNLHLKEDGCGGPYRALHSVLEPVGVLEPCYPG